MTCIAYHLNTGERCTKAVGISPLAQQYKLCRKHCKTVPLHAFAAAADFATREKLARGRWTNVKELS